MGGGAAAAGLDEVASGGMTGDVLLNTTSVGMAPAADATPVPQAVLGGYALVFDAIYTPLETRLLRARAPPAAACRREISTRPRLARNQPAC
jgi:shikimate 5-dehydrogenase